MSDAAWALAFGYLTMVTTWLLSYYFPRGRMSKRATKYSVPSGEGDKEADKEQE